MSKLLAVFALGILLAGCDTKEASYPKWDLADPKAYRITTDGTHYRAEISMGDGTWFVFAQVWPTADEACDHRDRLVAVSRDIRDNPKAHPKHEIVPHDNRAWTNLPPILACDK